MAGSVAMARLMQERKNWRKDHPFGFVAKPEAGPDGSTNFYVWKCFLPGKKGTDWEGGLYPVTIKFTEDYPSKPPICYLPVGFFHPNIYDSGRVCLSIINEGDGGSWKPSISVKQILEGIQTLLTEPNNADAAQQTAYDAFKRNKSRYNELVRRQARKYHSENIAL